MISTFYLSIIWEVYCIILLTSMSVSCLWFFFSLTAATVVRTLLYLQYYFVCYIRYLVCDFCDRVITRTQWSSSLTAVTVVRTSGRSVWNTTHSFAAIELNQCQETRPDWSATGPHSGITSRHTSLHTCDQLHFYSVFKNWNIYQKINSQIVHSFLRNEFNVPNL